MATLIDRLLGTSQEDFVKGMNELGPEGVKLLPPAPEPSLMDKLGEFGEDLRRNAQPGAIGSTIRGAVQDYVVPVAENIGERAISNVGGLTNFVEGLAGLEQGTIAEAFAPNEGEPSGETQVRQQLLQSAVEAEQQGRPQTEVSKLIAENPNASVQEVAAAKSKVAKRETEEAMQAEGTWTEEWQKGWDKFNEEYDLATVGLALMSSNDGRRTLTQNLGMALNAGRQAVVNRKVAARTEAREDLKVQIDLMNAWTARKRAIATAKDMKVSDANPTAISVMNNAAARAGIELDEIENSEDVIRELAALWQTELDNNPNTAASNANYGQQVADRIFQDIFNERFEDKSMFGGFFGRQFEPR